MKIAPLALAALGALSLATFSEAVSIDYDFYKLTRSSQPNPGNELYPDVGSGFAHNHDFVGNPSLSYTVGGVKVTATATFEGKQATPMQDREVGWTEGSPPAIPPRGAGLGVFMNPYVDESGKKLDEYTDAELLGIINPSDDNIDAGESLTLSFDRVVTLTKIALRANGHSYTNWLDDATFLLNGVSYALPKNVGYITGSWTGSVFEFAHSGGFSTQTNNVPTHDFYVAAVRVHVPDTGATAAMLGIALLAFLGVVRHYRLK